MRHAEIVREKMREISENLHGIRSVIEFSISAGDQQVSCARGKVRMKGTVCCSSRSCRVLKFIRPGLVSKSRTGTDYSSGVYIKSIENVLYLGLHRSDFTSLLSYILKHNQIFLKALT